jgi:IclR family transcriptional regulator, KDG regulon repressor
MYLVTPYEMPLIGDALDANPSVRGESTVSKSGLKMLDILEVIGVSIQPMGLLEIVGELGLDKSTTARLLAALVQRDYVTRDADTKRYRIGPGFLGVSSAVTSRAQIIRAVYPLLLKLGERTGETVSLHIRAHRERICITSVERFPPSIDKRRLGVRYPLFVGTAGKVILAFCDPEIQKDAIRESSARGADPKALTASLARARELGWLEDVAEINPELGAISAAVFSDEAVFGSIGVIGPLDRLGRDARQQVAPVLRDCAIQVSEVVSATHVHTYQS